MADTLCPTPPAPRSVELAREILANPHLYSPAAVAWARQKLSS